MRNRLDLFGVLVLSFAASNAGGVARDVLIGATPPAALQDWRYITIAMLAGTITFYRAAAIERLRNPVQMFDAAGLAVFAVIGALKALEFGLGPISAILLGMLSGIGGGITRDILVARTPVIFQSELYAVAAMAGAAAVVAGNALGMPRGPVIGVAVILCFGLRYMAIRHGWHLPVAEHRDP